MESFLSVGSGAFRQAVERVVDAARWAASADNGQPWRFVLREDVLSVMWRESGEPPLFGPRHPATALSVGGVLENIDRACVELGLQAERVTPTEDEGGDRVYAAFRLSQIPGDAEKTGSVSPNVRHTNRLPFRRDLLPQRLLDSVGEMVEGGARLLVCSSPAAVGAWADLVELASRIRFRTQDVHEGLARSLRFSDAEVERNDGLDVATLHLPPGGSAFLRFVGPWERMSLLNRIGAFRFMAKVEAQPVRTAPALIAVVAPSEWDEAVAAGRLLHRSWEALNREGVAVHPYYVIADQLQRFAEGRVPESCRAEAAALAEAVQTQAGLAPGETVHMLLRTGYPRRTPLRSRRLSSSRLLAPG